MTSGKSPPTPPAKPAPGNTAGQTAHQVTLRLTNNVPKHTITISYETWISLQDRARAAGIGTVEGYIHELIRPNPSNHPNRSKNKNGEADE